MDWRSDMAKTESKKDRTEKKRKQGHGLLVFLLAANSLLLIILIQFSYLFFLAGMLPSIVAYVTDRSEEKHLFHTIFACNLAGVLPYVTKLVQQGNSMSAVNLMMSDALTWFVMYSAAAIGWMLVWLSPYLAEIYLKARRAQEIERIETFQKKLIAEWGPEIKRKPVP